MSTVGFSDPRLADVLLETHHYTHVFPTISNVTCTLTAGGSPNVASSWIEIADSGATTLSSKFSANTGHISGIEIFECNQADKMYIVDFSYGTAKTSITSFHFISNTAVKKLIPKLIMVNANEVPSGETVYYRMMRETADKTLIISLRYHHED